MDAQNPVLMTVEGIHQLLAAMQQMQQDMKQLRDELSFFKEENAQLKAEMQHLNLKLPKSDGGPLCEGCKAEDLKEPVVIKGERNESEQEIVYTSMQSQRADFSAETVAIKCKNGQFGKDTGRTVGTPHLPETLTPSANTRLLSEELGRRSSVEQQQYLAKDVTPMKTGDLDFVPLDMSVEAVQEGKTSDHGCGLVSDGTVQEDDLSATSTPRPRQKNPKIGSRVKQSQPSNDRFMSENSSESSEELQSLHVEESSDDEHDDSLHTLNCSYPCGIAPRSKSKQKTVNLTPSSGMSSNLNSHRLKSGKCINRKTISHNNRRERGWLPMWKKVKPQTTQLITAEQGIRMVSPVKVKIHFCLFCEKALVKINLHFRKVHRREKQVIDCMKGNSRKKRLQMFQRLRNIGDHLNNLRVLKRGWGVFCTARMSRDKTGSKDNLKYYNYVPCTYCIGYFYAERLWSHVCQCVSPNPMKLDRHRRPAGACLLFSGDEEASAMVPTLFKSQQVDNDNDYDVDDDDDDVNSIIQSDSLIRRLVEMELSRALTKRKGKELDKSKLRDLKKQVKALCRVVLELRRSNDQKTRLEDFLNPAGFQLILNTVQKIFTKGQPKGNSLSNRASQRLRMLLVRSSYLLLARVLSEKGDAEREIDIRAFEYCCHSQWLKIPTNSTARAPPQPAIPAGHQSAQQTKDLERREVPQLKSSDKELDLEPNNCEQGDQNAIDSDDRMEKSQKNGEPLGIEIVPGRKSKVHICLFCRKAKVKMARHMMTCHMKRAQVREMLKQEDDRQRHLLMDKLRNMGDHEHNVRVLQQGRGKFVIANTSRDLRQRRINSSCRDYLPCTYCFGYFLKTRMGFHVLHCQHSPGENLLHDEDLKKGSLDTLFPTDEKALTVLRNLFESDTVAVRRVVQKDRVVRKLGEREIHNALNTDEGFTETKKLTVMSKIQSIAKVVAELQRVSENEEAWLDDYVSPRKFDLIVSTVEHLSSSECHEERALSFNAVERARIQLSKACTMLKLEARTARNENLQSSIRSFEELCNAKWPSVPHLGHLDLDPVPGYKYHIFKNQRQKQSIPVKSGLVKSQSRTETEQRDNRKQDGDGIESANSVCNEHKDINCSVLGQENLAENKDVTGKPAGPLASSSTCSTELQFKAVGVEKSLLRDLLSGLFCSKARNENEREADIVASTSSEMSTDHKPVSAAEPDVLDTARPTKRKRTTDSDTESEDLDEDVQKTTALCPKTGKLIVVSIKPMASGVKSKDRRFYCKETGKFHTQKSMAARSRQKWSEEEKETVLRHLGKWISMGTLPGKAAIDACLEREASVLGHRSWRTVKDFCRNAIARNQKEIDVQNKISPLCQDTVVNFGDLHA